MAKKASASTAYKGIYCDGLRVGIWTKFVDGIQNTFKAHGGVWIPKPVGIWVLPKSKAADCIAGLANALPGEFSEIIGMAMFQRAKRKQEPFWAASSLPSLHQDMFADGHTGGWMFAQRSFDPVFLTVMKKNHLAHWDSPTKAWVFPASMDRHSVLSFLESAGFPEHLLLPAMASPADAPVWRPYLTPVGSASIEEVTLTVNVEDGGSTGRGTTEKTERPEIALLSRSMQAHAVDEVLLDELTARFTLMPHQPDGVRHLLKFDSALLAFDMGLGKTRTTIAASAVQGKKLIVCPASLKLNWKSEIERVIPDATIYVDGIDRKEDMAERDWIVTNYERLDDDEFRKSLEGEVLIVDEAHYLKNPLAQRTQHIAEIAKRVGKKWLLTATPVLNRADELYSLLSISGHFIAGEMDFKKFRKEYDDPDAYALLGARISEWCMKKNKNDVLQLQGKVHYEPIITLGDEQKMDYGRACTGTHPLAVLTRTRQWIERTKATFIEEMLEDLQHSAKAIVFCNFTATVDRFMRHLSDSAVRLTGEENMKERNAAVVRFQNDPECRFFIANTKAGGVGLNLTAASYVFFASRPWTPAEQVQAEDRAYRIGQTGAVEVYNPLIPNTLDEEIKKLLESKGKVSEELLAEALARGRGERLQDDEESDVPDDVFLPTPQMPVDQPVLFG
ncbi:DEAD/DEAH box helicase [Acidithiobacillus ferrooxidans]|uniref:DEAD/DEAH box helicase n=1 Tax=Acidithiobacillus ferrooxidans TaxID=920 RepID=UPI000ADFBB97|nr:DEAD/DEAH box helicase [Acidithiobacillus ferrooxidans]